MVLFFSNGETVYAVETVRDFDGEDIRKLDGCSEAGGRWLRSGWTVFSSARAAR